LHVARRLQSRGVMASTGILSDMRALLLEPDREWLEQRRRDGLDRRDEVWEGVLHVVPPPRTRHELIARDLADILMRVARPLALEVFQHFAIYPSERNYRQPDVVVIRREDLRDIGAVTAELAIEVLSPNDESRDKLPFYAAQQVGEVWLVDPQMRATEVYVLRGGTYFAVVPSRPGIINAPRLGLELSVIDGPRLRIAWQAGSADV
jgi:Uma2 family endonuclease